ncbi:MAG: 5-formyltetrahydrofolate cyclo-ligase [Verrucomicrobiota bacterium]
MNLNEQKIALRKKIRAELEKKTEEKRRLDSKKLCAKLKGQSFFQAAATVLFFAPLPNEADVWPLLEESLAAGKTVALPRFDSARKNYSACRVQHLIMEVVSGQFGIREPDPDCIEIPLDQLDLILVPGVAFDLHGHRLGRGKGFYDRLLTEAGGVKCGMTFDEQVVNEIPKESHDIHMNFILTPTRCVTVAS